MDPQYKKWDEITDKIDKLNIIDSIEMLTGYLENEKGEFERTTTITVHPDVKFKGLKYTTYDLEDMIEELEVYYLRAKNANWWRGFWDIITSLWWAWVSAFVLLHTVTYIVTAIAATMWLNDAGLLPEIIEAIMEKLP